MAHLTKEQYDKRRENAACRMAINSEIESLTPEQHEAMAKLCTARHELHSNQAGVIKSDEAGYKADIITANIALVESGLESIPGIGTDASDYIDIDSISELSEIEGIDSDDEGYQDWYDDNYSRISEELEALNTKIEKYLQEIDQKAGTNYAPTGLQRIF